jgi:hypothetical protein
MRYYAIDDRWNGSRQEAEMTTQETAERAILRIQPLCTEFQQLDARRRAAIATGSTDLRDRLALRQYQIDCAVMDIAQHNYLDTAVAAAYLWGVPPMA